MVDHYLDLTLRADPEFAPQLLMASLYAKLHHALVAADHGRIGVSFPDVSESTPWLGERLRLHARQADLLALIRTDWLGGMRDHVDWTAPALVPRQTEHRTVRRVQADSSPDRLRRRLMHRHQINAATATERIPDSAAVFLKLPFLQMRSGSTGHRFRLFIEHGPVRPAPSVGTFSSYGLSPTTTIPWF